MMTWAWVYLLWSRSLIVFLGCLPIFVIFLTTGELVKPGDTKCVLTEGMPTYRRPFEKGRLIIHFSVRRPKSLSTTCLGFLLLKSVKCHWKAQNVHLLSYDYECKEDNDLMLRCHAYTTLGINPLWLLSLGGVPTSQFPPRKQAEGARALPPGEDGCRAARQYGWGPLHIRRSGGLWLREQETTQASVLLHGWRRLCQRWWRSVPDILNRQTAGLCHFQNLHLWCKAPFFGSLCTFSFCFFISLKFLPSWIVKKKKKCPSSLPDLFETVLGDGAAFVEGPGTWSWDSSSPLGP